MTQASPNQAGDRAGTHAGKEASTQPAPGHAAPAPLGPRDHVPCASCGYELYALPEDAACPECGTPARESRAVLAGLANHAAGVLAVGRASRIAQHLKPASTSLGWFLLLFYVGEGISGFLELVITHALAPVTGLEQMLRLLVAGAVALLVLVHARAVRPLLEALRVATSADPTGAPAPPPEKGWAERSLEARATPTLAMRLAPTLAAMLAGLAILMCAARAADLVLVLAGPGVVGSAAGGVAWGNALSTLVRLAGATTAALLPVYAWALLTLLWPLAFVLGDAVLTAKMRASARLCLKLGLVALVILALRQTPVGDHALVGVARLVVGIMTLVVVFTLSSRVQRLALALRGRLDERAKLASLVSPASPPSS